MEGIGHSYPTGHDLYRDVNRKELMIDFFDYYLKPGNTIAPQIVGITPIVSDAKWEGDDIFLRLMWEGAPFFLLTLRYDGDKLVEAILDGKKIR